nr:MAG TPA: hypothetical protein [Caudoviricetes sp.]DAR32361.1 MAG TPA: hypothetical protein [Caudoviricetes sp.]
MFHYVCFRDRKSNKNRLIIKRNIQVFMPVKQVTSKLNYHLFSASYTLKKH